MYFLLTASVYLSAFVIGTSCEINNLEYSNSAPWALVYTVYPFYNSETVLEVWKDDKIVDTASTGTVMGDDQEKTLLYSNDMSLQNDTINLGLQGGMRPFAKESMNMNTKDISKNRQRLLSYRNWQKDTNFQNDR